MHQLHRYTSSLLRAVHLFCIATIVFVASVAVSSCDNDDDQFPVYPLNRPNAIVTVKPSADGTLFFVHALLLLICKLVFMANAR